jgi:PAS domain S-box-containing protein
LIAAVCGLIGQRDYAARGHAEAAFLESEDRFRILVEGVQDYAIFRLDSSGKIVSWNAGAERIQGYKAEDNIGQNCKKIVERLDGRIWVELQPEKGSSFYFALPERDGN